MNILVLCTGNSARSILLEAILGRLGAPLGLRAYSAGSRPAGHVHPQSLRLLAGYGYPLEGLRSKSWEEFGEPGAPQMDAVITVCGSAAGESCPLWPGAPLRAHWGVEDPAASAEADWPTAFQAAYDALFARATYFIDQGPQALDRAGLRALLTKAGQIT
ncbi:MAG: arsenate reductase ArsC [Paracoccaceae bacterium]